MDQPWYFIGFGAMFTAFGGALTWIGFANDAPYVGIVGWAIGGLASVALFVGIIALGVEVGTRAARR